MSDTLKLNHPYTIDEALTQIESAPQPLQATLERILVSLKNNLEDTGELDNINVFFYTDFDAEPFPEQPYIFDVKNSNPIVKGYLSVYVYDELKWTIDGIYRDDVDYPLPMNHAIHWIVP